ncbi:hypothetical protein KSS87_019832 [Heliosperma pusillum]|nr:hypothetical protein KSS87_019832 [Heliosperma pusillum]
MIENGRPSREKLNMTTMTIGSWSVIERAIECLGKGFDLTSDFRLKFCKGGHGDRLVVLNDDHKRPLVLPGFGAFHEPVSIDIKCDKGDHTRHQSDILDFSQIPSGLFNSMFNYESGSWAKDAANTNMLGIDGYSIVLFNLHIDRYPLILSDDLRNSVPQTWDPLALSRFIEKYGTHVIVGISIGGEDMVLVKQDKSSKLNASQLKKHLYELGDQLFTGICTLSSKHGRTKDNKLKVPSAFNIYEQLPFPTHSFPNVTSKQGITVICAKRGGDVSIKEHSEWLPTVALMPDAINLSFIPITSLLKGVPGKGFLSHAINLYLRHKPPIADLRYFLEFQSNRIWAPIHSDLPLAPTTNMPLPTSALYFNLMAPKLLVNTTQVNAENKPVTGVRLYLEGMRNDRLAIHLQHLSNMPLILENKIEKSPSLWRGSDEISDGRYFEPVQKKNYSHICSAPVKYNPSWKTSEQENTAFIVTGAQLYTKTHDSKQVLHIRLLYSKVLDFEIVQSEWDQSSQGSTSQKSRLLSMSLPSTSGNLDKEQEQGIVVDSGLFPTGPPVPVQNQKLLRFVNTFEIFRGPQDNPGYWIVTGAKLDLIKSKICLQVKFSLLNMVPC